MKKHRYKIYLVDSFIKANGVTEPNATWNEKERDFQDSFCHLRD
jgi:hypothetical protein